MVETKFRAELATLLMLGGAFGCEGPPSVPEHPTWGDVAPILQGECNHCHGATARTTGSLGPAIYRFDFFDMNDAVCGEAAAAMDVPALAAASAGLIKADITPMGGHRPKMPPAPASPLQDWQRETIQRWADAPVKGPPPPGNRRPRIRVNRLPTAASGQLSFLATIEDPDNDSVIAVLQFEDLIVKLDHPGTFAVGFDLAGMAPGSHRLSAVLCDGWGNIGYDLGPIRIEK
jgi:hypothetical protein